MTVAESLQSEQKIVLIQGEYRVTDKPNVVLSTLLGSCVAMCLFDANAHVGGMNHFLLPGSEADEQTSTSLRYGVHAMELLVNDLLKSGARRQNLRAKLFGGARMLAGLTDLGARNAGFAENYLRRENIPMVGGSLRGDRGRRIEFWPFSGRTRQLLIGGPPKLERYPPVPDEHGAMELF